MSLRAVSVRRGGRWVLHGITWRLEAGERWALLGDNGAGKTQLLKLLSGEVWPTPTSTPTLKPARGGADGRSFFLGRRALQLREAKPRIAYIGAERQDKYARYDWNLPVRDVIASGLQQSDLKLARLEPGEVRRVDRIARACGLARLAARRFLSLSYGEKRLTLLARALVQEPDWLLLDEFYNGLDECYRRRVEGVLERARRRGQGWVATAHRAQDVPRGTCSLIVLGEGRIRALGRLSRAHIRRLRARAAERAGAERVRAAAATARRRPLQRHGPVLLRLSHVDLYVEYRMVLKNLDWRVHRGEHWVVTGANGAGKSSLLKLLYGDLAPALGGRIERAGLPRGSPIAAWKQQVGYVSPELQSDYANGVDILELAASGRHSSIGLNEPPTPSDLAAARRWLKFFGLSRLSRRPARELSYGQLRRALLARAMAAQARILLLDEPLTGLDAGQRARMKRLLASLMKKGVTVIAAVHHREDLPPGMTHELHLHKRHASVIDCHSAT